jgi:hypothetical protein
MWDGYLVGWIRRSTSTHSDTQHHQTPPKSPPSQINDNNKKSSQDEFLPEEDCRRVVAACEAAVRSDAFLALPQASVCVYVCVFMHVD